MEMQKDFTVDNETFYGLDAYFKSLQANGMHIIIILVRRHLGTIFLNLLHNSLTYATFCDFVNLETANPFHMMKAAFNAITHY